MTSPENSTNEKPASVSLTITNLDLPELKEQRDALLDEVEENLETLLIAEFDQPAVVVDYQVDHWYASVQPNCPDCDEPLDIQGIHLGDGEDAFAIARCADDCGWTGDAVFKLIDLDADRDADYKNSALDNNT